MPKITGVLDSTAISVTNITMSLPAHKAGDLLLCYVAKQDTTGGNWECATTGWSTPVTIKHTTTGTTTASGCYGYKFAESSAEPAPTFSTTDTDVLVGVAICVTGVDTTTPIEASATLATGFAYDTPVVTTLTADALVLHSIALTTANLLRYSWMQILPEYEHQQLFVGNSNNICLSVFARPKPTTGATEVIRWKGSSGTPISFAMAGLALKDDGTGQLQAYPDALSDVTVLDFMRNETTADNPLGNTFSTTGTLTISPINGRACSGDAPTKITGGNVNYYEGVIASTPSRNTVTNQGIYLDFGTNRDLSDGVIIGSLTGAKASDITGIGGYLDEGLIFAVGDGTNHTAWTIVASDSIDVQPAGRNFYVIQPSQTTDTSLEDLSPTLTSVAGMQWCGRSLATAMANMNLYYGNVLFVKKLVAAGASATYPMTFDELSRWVCNFYSSPLMLRHGAASGLLMAPLQFGGGDPCHAKLDACAIQFPESASTAQPAGRIVCGVHVDPGYLGLSFNCQVGDTMRLTNSIVSSLTPFHFNVLSTASASATWDFSGLTLVNAIVTLRPVADFSGMTLVDSTVAHNLTAMDACVFSDSIVTSANPSNITSSRFTSGSTVTPAQSVEYIVDIGAEDAAGNIVHVPDTTLVNMIDTDGVTTGATVTVTGGTLMTAGVDQITGVFPAEVTDDGRYVTTGTMTVAFAGLPVGASFDVNILASRTDNDGGNGRWGKYTVATSETTDIDVIDASDNVTPKLFSVVVGANGLLDITVEKDPDHPASVYAYINGIQLVGTIAESSSGGGHALVITAPGSYTLDGLIFAGYGADDSTDAAVYNNSGGAVTLSVSGGGSTPTVRNGTSASTTVESGAGITVEGLVTGSRVVAKKVSDNTVLFNGSESTGSITFSTTYIGAIKLEARKASASPFYKPWVTLITPVSGQTSVVTALQELDE